MDVTNGDDEYNGFVGIGDYNFRELESLTSLHISSSYIFPHGGPHPDREELWSHLPPQLEKLQIDFGSFSGVFSACRLTRLIMPESDREGLNEFEPSDVNNISEEQTRWLRQCLCARKHEQLIEPPHEKAPRSEWPFPQKLRSITLRDPIPKTPHRVLRWREPDFEKDFVDAGIELDVQLTEHQVEEVQFWFPWEAD
ncbi:hypothetical protein BCR34DRAFT_321269 [Clohesyomyces aquaticus]|uniref:Uncharacterized protein n=1 Tax=Clohesyomyces aquaticus TaxID=1231657 RepID=A0A1Y2A8D2_9PLEO|nr:hypothetical protein BCR34DRAFT_321269 [Clohesyomyces aquaticus]